MSPWLTSKSWSTWISRLSPGIACVCHYTQLISLFREAYFSEMRVLFTCSSLRPCYICTYVCLSLQNSLFWNSPDIFWGPNTNSAVFKVHLTGSVLPVMYLVWNVFRHYKGCIKKKTQLFSGGKEIKTQNSFNKSKDNPTSKRQQKDLHIDFWHASPCL